MKRPWKCCATPWTSASAIYIRHPNRRPYCTSDTAQRRVLAYRGFWQDAENLKSFFDALAPTVGVRQMEDWYSVSRDEVRGRGGRGLFRHHSSLGDALKVAYPEFPWRLEGFAEVRTPPRYWQDKKRLMGWIDKAEELLGIKKIEDWYSVAMTDLRELGVSARVSRMTLVELLSEKYPDFRWDKVYMLRGKYAEQKRLERMVASLFPGEEIQTNVRKEAGLINPQTGAYLELDIYIPSLSLAMEYQDIHHYKTASYAYQPLQEFQVKDSIKKDIALSKGLTLLTIPCWWDGTEESLVATIKAARPDLLVSTEGTQPIPLQMPPNFLVGKRKTHIEDIGEPTTACFLTDSQVDPTNWWLFEKYDGIRAFWNPSKKTFYSRLGNVLNIPQEIVDAMPEDIFLDGEIWFGRETFETATKISRRAHQREIDWNGFKFMVFDVPKTQGTYTKRYEQLVNHPRLKQLPFLEIASREVCTGTDHFEKFFQDVIDKGGEGVILRNPNEAFTPGRARGYLKHKKFRDAEALIVASVGNGQWECELPNGTTFIAVPGTTEFAKRWNPTIGDVVTFKHKGFLLGSKKPLSPILYRLRPDLSWTDVVQNWKDQKPRILTSEKTVKKGIGITRKPTFAAKALSYKPSSESTREKRVPKKVKPRNYWAEAENCRKLFDGFAKERQFNPLDPNNWYSVTSSDFAGKVGASSMFAKQNGWRKALRLAYPEVKFDGEEWKKQVRKRNQHKEMGDWRDQESRRQFFCEFAEERGLDPLSPVTWENVTKRQITEKLGGWAVLAHSKRNLVAALQDAFPELQLKQKEIGTHNKVLWKEIENCRKFFDQLAHEMQFDPLQASNWHSLNVSSVYRNMKGAKEISSVHGGIRNALELAYPELQLQEGWA